MRRMTSTLIFAVALATASTSLAGSLSGTVTCSGMRSNAHAVVYIERIEGKTFQPPSSPAVIDQKGKMFVPRVLPVVVGTTVEFLNSDPFVHNVFTPDGCAGKFNLGSWPTGETRSYTFLEPCEAVLLCNVHPEMVAFIVAVETPYFAVTDDEGRYTIEDLPDGTHNVAVWHERLKRQRQTVTVSGDTAADFELKR